jgi:hypothetical protein
MLDKKEYLKQWRAKNKERVKETTRAWELNNKDKRLASKKAYYHRDIEKSREYSRTQNKKHTQMLYDTVITHYGGTPPKCNCCGESEKTFLVLDHINNNGTKQRKKIGTGYKLFSWIIKNNFPDEYQVLCSNCNLSKMRGKGTCIHKAVASRSMQT